MYTWANAEHSLVLRESDGANIPAVEENRDYHDVLAWIAAGNVVAPFVPPALSSAEVTAERDRRLRRFTFNGKLFDFCDGKGSDINIAGAGTLALASMMTGAPWDEAFLWIAADNSEVSMDASTCFNFAKAAADWKAKHIYAARALKNMSPIPSDFTDDSYWV